MSHTGKSWHGAVRDLLFTKVDRAIYTAASKGSSIAHVDVTECSLEVVQEIQNYYEKLSNPIFTKVIKKKPQREGEPLVTFLYLSSDAKLLPPE